MAGSAHSVYFPELEYYIKGASVAGNATFMADNVLKTLRDFCLETWIWREELTAIDVVDETDGYTMAPGVTNCDSPDVHMVDWVKYKVDDAEDTQYVFLKPINLESEEIPGSMSAGWVFEEGDAPQIFYVNPDDELIIKPIPNENAAGTANLLVKTILKPALDATTSPPFIYNEWAETIAKGAAARIMKLASKKWYNPQLGQAYWGEYMQERNDEARAQRWGGKGRTKLYVRQNRAFNGGHRSRNWIF